MPIEGCALSADNVLEITACECEVKSDLIEVIEACGSFENFNRRLRTILCAAITHAEEPSEQEDTAAAIRRRSTRRLSGTILLTEELGHLVRQFEKFQPGCES